MDRENTGPKDERRERESQPATERELEREQEDTRFVPVIIKRNDEARRHPDDILQAAIEDGEEQLHRAPFSLFLSAVGAGLILGFTAMSVGLMSSLVADLDSRLIETVAIALVYPLGFVVCLMSGTELFTEHTATAVYPVLDKQSGVWRLLRLWVLVGAGNLLGTFLSAGLLTAAEDVIQARDGYIRVAHHLVGAEALPLVASAVLAGWMMALAAWLILATPPTISQLASVYIATFIIGFGGLHHSIAGSAEMFTALLIGDEFTLGQAIRFIALAMAGNLVGGSLFVAGLNYAHIRKSQAPD